MSVQQIDGTLLLSDIYNDPVSTSASRYLLLKGDTISLMQQRTITNSNDTGYAGEFCMDSNYFYYCVANDTWKRIALNTW